MDWECPACTLRNNARAAECIVCGEAKPSGAPSGAPAPDPPIGAEAPSVGPSARSAVARDELHAGVVDTARALADPARLAMSNDEIARVLDVDARALEAALAYETFAPRAAAFQRSRSGGADAAAAAAARPARASAGLARADSDLGAEVVARLARMGFERAAIVDAMRSLGDGADVDRVVAVLVAAPPPPPPAPSGSPSAPPSSSCANGACSPS